MAFDFAAAKAKVRRITHKTFALDAEYETTTGGREPDPIWEPLRVRWHNKLTNVGDPLNEGYPVTIDTIDKVIFDVAELADKEIRIARGGRLKITANGFGGQILVIDTRDPKCGPSEEVWLVAKAPSGEFNP